MDFSAERFVDDLQTEGCKCLYENSHEYSGAKEDIPEFYDEEMFRKGQNFFNKYRASVFLGCMLSLVMGFSHPMVRILVMTKKSSTPITAYKRYSATIMHMCTWYESNLKPGSKLWSSVKKVRNMHYYASKQGRIRSVYQITQCDMVATINGFMGLPLIGNKMIGIYDASEEELKCFIHFWRVMGYLFGIDDRFNLCRGSVEETKKICTLLLVKYLDSEMKEGEENFDHMTRAFIEGMKGVCPFISYDQTIAYLNMVVGSISSNNHFKQIVSQETTRRNYITFLIWIMRFDLGRIVVNYFIYMVICLLRYFPVFAYSQFGMKHSHVTI